MKRSWMISILLVFLLLTTACGSIPPDRTVPSSPLLTVGSKSSEAVRLIWSGSYDDTGVVAYHLYRDGKRIAIVSKTEYTDRGIKKGEEYTYEVVAVDAAGNQSERSAPQYVDTTGAAAADVLPAAGKLNIQDLSKSTVKVYIVDDEYNIVGTGSGTILDESGYILTNNHCVADEKGLYNKEGYIGIALTDDVKTYSQPQYLARVMARDAKLDLAVVKLEGNLDGSPLRKMPYLSPIITGDSNALRLGDDVNVLGFPGVGGETITFTSGKVSGFIDEDGDGRTDWIKTDALVNHGNSGGTAINAAGEMIGVPTSKIGGEDNDQMFFLRPFARSTEVINAANKAFASGETNVTLDTSGAGPTGNSPAPSADSTPAPSADSTPKPSPGAGETAGNRVTVSGTIVDADTGKSLPGAVFFVLRPGVAADAWMDNQDDKQVISYGEADRDGWFETGPAFEAGGTHGVVVWLEGYELIVVDAGISFATSDSGRYDIGEVFLTQAP